MNDIQNDPELQLDLNTDELSKHLIKKKKKTSIDQDWEKEDKNEYNKYEKSQDDVANKESNEKSVKENDEESMEEEEADDDDDDENNDPKILITTHELKISFKTYKLCRELSRILPNADYFYRKFVRLSKIIPEAIKRSYSAIIVINEDHKEPSTFN